MDKTYTSYLLKKHGVAARKKYGQNFLIDDNILKKIVLAANVGPEDTVLEIGPGTGSLTQSLAAAAGKVIAVEIDEGMLPILRESLLGRENVTVVHADILKWEIDPRIDKVVANLPYYITTPILLHLLEHADGIREMLFMVQKEVADRLTSGPGTKDYGALTLAAQYRAEVSVAAIVPASCFHPRPNVDSALVHFKLRKWTDEEQSTELSEEEETKLFRVIRAAFNQRRKTLANALSNAQELPCTREEVRDALCALGLPETVRGEALSLAQFVALSKTLR